MRHLRQLYFYLYFLVVNIFIIWLLSLSSDNLILEIYKWLQFISLILLVLYLIQDSIRDKNKIIQQAKVTSMVAIIIDKYKGKVIETRYSHMDIMPSILELFGISFNNKFSRSFIKELDGEKVPKKKILLIQPYADRYINIIDYPLKYQYNSAKGKSILYNLEKDPNEENGQIIGHNKEKNLQLIEGLLGAKC